MSLVLSTPRLAIRPLTRVDVADFVAYRRVPEVARYQSWTPDYSTADAEALVAAQPASGVPKQGEWVQLGLHAPVGPEGAVTLVGDVAIGVDADQPDTYELGITLAPHCQGLGYAGEALESVIDWLMTDRGAHRIVMQCDARNEATVRLMARLGLRHEGSIVEGDWFKGEWTTLERFAVLRREWETR